MKIHLTFVSAGIVLLAAACQTKQEGETEPVVRPVLSFVASPRVSRAVGFAGIVEPRYQTSLGFRILGRILSRDVGLGDTVKRGARLATLDPVALELAVRSARAGVESAEARLANATANEARQHKLLEERITSQAQFELAQRARETAAAGLDQARALLTKAQEQLGYAELQAEFDGVVTSVQVEAGQVVSPGQTVLTLARPDLREAVVDLPDHLAGDLREGARFSIALQLDPSVTASGSLREIAPQSDPLTRTRRVRITLEAPPRGFRLGTTVTATPVTTPASRIELPASGLLERDGKAFVWVVDPASSKVFPREVTVAARDGRWIELAGGLAQGSRVVVAGLNSLEPGQLVKISDGARP